MAKTKRQKSRRLQNRLMFESRVNSGSLLPKHTQGVGFKQACKVKGNQCLPELAGDDSFNDVYSNAFGVYNAYQKSYKHSGLGKHKTHIRTPSDYLYKLREARKKYRALFNAYDMGKARDAVIFDRIFKQKFPKEWQLIIENVKEF